MKHKLYRLFLLAVSAAAIFVSCGEKTVPVTALEINPDYLDLLLGSSAALTATVKPANATEQTVTWSSTAPGTVSVDNNGTVSARQAGQATINATCDGKSASCIVKVIVPTESVALDKTEITLKKGDSAILTASVNPSEATDKVVSWTSSQQVAPGNMLSARSPSGTPQAETTKAPDTRTGIDNSNRSPHRGNLLLNRGHQVP